MEKTIMCMGGDLYVSLDAKKEQEAMEALRTKLSELLAVFDFFSPISLLTQLNRERIVPFNKHLMRVLRRSKELFIQTHGTFNVFLGETITERKQGTEYNSSQPTQPTLTITQDNISLSGTDTIDLGGIAKGYILDVLVGYVTKKFSVHNLLLDARGDFRCYGRTKKVIGVENPFSETAFTTVALSSGAVVTSGHNKQYFAGGSHIIGKESDVLTITLVSKSVSCGDLDAYGTYLLQLPSEESLQLLEFNPMFADVEALIVLKKGLFLQTMFWETYRSNTLPPSQK